MYSRYNPTVSESFYPVSQIAPRSQSPEPPVSEEPNTKAVFLPGNFFSGILDSLKGENGKMDYGSLILLLITIMLFLEDGDSGLDLIIITAAMLLIGF